MRIETERLLLRPFEEGDLEDLYRLLAPLKDDEFEGYPGITRESCREHLAYRLGTEEFFAMVRKETGRVIGNIYCGKRDFAARELGYILRGDHQGQGYAVEALTAVLQSVFTAGEHRVYLECDPRNTASWRLAERAGLRREAHFRQNVWFHRDENGRPLWKDTYVYALLREEWAMKEGGSAVE